jgi:small subunit ribosomal protein S19e
MVSVKDVDPQKLVEKLKEELKKIEEIKEPNWAKFVKSGTHRQRPPEQKDFWYIRAASILRRIYLDGPVGVERLRNYYGGKKNYGQAPEHFVKSSGKIIRTILQQLENAGLVEKESGKKKGRKITPKGRKFLDRIAYEVSKL